MNGTNNMASAELAWTNICKNTQAFYLHHFSKGYLFDVDRKIHPTQKPVMLYRWILENHAKDTDKILDTHLGSGSIGIACKYFEVQEFVGIEIDAEYFNAAKKRINEHVVQGELI